MRVQKRVHRNNIMGCNQILPESTMKTKESEKTKVQKKKREPKEQKSIHEKVDNARDDIESDDEDEMVIISVPDGALLESEERSGGITTK